MCTTKSSATVTLAYMMETAGLCPLTDVPRRPVSQTIVEILNASVVIVIPVKNAKLKSY